MSEHTGRGVEEDASGRPARSWLHAAVRAGDVLTQLEMKTLVDRLFATAPHGVCTGRPTLCVCSELHRRFGRT